MNLIQQALDADITRFKKENKELRQQFELIRKNHEDLKVSLHSYNQIQINSLSFGQSNLSWSGRQRIQSFQNLQATCILFSLAGFEIEIELDT